jgi:NADH:ubiquinone oxidoreductase subunit
VRLFSLWFLHFMVERLSRIRRLSQLGTRLDAWLNGIAVGRDSVGNRYYRARRKQQGQCERRWVIYAGEPEASVVPPEWHFWLHHLADSPLPVQSRFHQPWQKPHQPDLTGTVAAWLPAWHTLRGGSGHQGKEEYQAWRPQD